MNFVNFLIDSEKMKKVCFLCFEINGENKLLYDEFVIQGTNINLKTSLFNIVRDLLPGYEMLFGQACNGCTSIITKMYYIKQDHLMKRDMLGNIVSWINHQIPNSNLEQKCIIRLPSDKKKSDGIANDENKEKHINVEECDSVTNQLKSDDSLQKHKLNLHDNSKSVVCHICGKSCIDPKALKAHLNCHIQKECPYCSKILKSHSHFNKHVKNHNKNVKRVRNKYNCPTCTYHSQNKIDMEAHNNKVHLKVKPYKCQQCLKCFYKKSNLSAHMITHFNLRNLVCEVCGQDFMYKKTLAEHLRLHSGEKIFKCDICQRNFTTQSRKNEHIKRNHSNEFFHCLICNKKYTLKKELNNHLKKFHKKL